MPLPLTVGDFTRNTEVLKVLADTEPLQQRVFSDVVDGEGHQYVDLVLEGGGMLGIALAGYTYVLERTGIRFMGIAGASAGSIVALLLAAHRGGSASTEVVRILADADMGSFVDGDASLRQFMGDVDHGASWARKMVDSLHMLSHVGRPLLRDLGLNPGTAFHAWMSACLEEVGIRTWGQLRQRLAGMPPGLRHRDGTALTATERPELAMVACDITTQTKVILPKMASLYWEDPDQVNPADFVRASMSIPFFFQPFRVGDVPQGAEAKANWSRLVSFDSDLPTEVLFLDGGVMSNFPINLFHVEGIPTAPTFGVQLGLKRKCVTIQDALHLGVAAFDAARHCLDFDFITSHPDYRHLVGIVDTGRYNWLDFDMPDGDKIGLFVAGVRAAGKFLSGFDWAAYKKLRGSLQQAYSQSPFSVPGAGTGPG